MHACASRGTRTLLSTWSSRPTSSTFSGPPPPARQLARAAAAAPVLEQLEARGQRVGPPSLPVCPMPPTRPRGPCAGGGQCAHAEE